MNRIVAGALLWGGVVAGGLCAEPLVYTVDPSKVEKTIDVGIHGQFLEHIFNSVHGGLWGDLVLNPSLEPNGGAALWTVKDDTITLPRPSTNQPLKLGDENWTDYTLTLEARRDEGPEGFLVMFRVAGDRHYWVNFGGWGNKEHGIEKGGAPLRVPHAKGTIEQGRWYKVRIVCAGPKFEIFLDDTKVMDVLDDRNPVLRGGIGLNTWNTRASFRNLKVTAPDGKVLFEGLPSKQDLASAPAYWSKMGKDGYLTSEVDHPLNNATAQILTSTRAGGEFGLQQRPVFLKRGETYCGSLYLRSAQGSTAAVRYLDEDGRVVFERAFEKLPADWKKFEFEFPADRAVTNAVFQIVAKGEGSVVVDQVNVFSKSALACGGFRPELLKAIADLKPGSIRYPGGCFASGYRWKDGIGPREKRTYFPGVIWDDRDPSQFGTDEFMLLCEKVGAQPVIAINMNRGVEEALDWMEYCNGPADSTWGKVRAANGHPKPYNVKVWEVDNETWGMGSERYAEVVKKFAPAMKAKYPDVLIAACGSYGYDDGKGSSNGWNKRLLDAAAKDIDLLSIHYYNGIAYGQDWVADPRKFEAFIRDDIGALIRASANPKMRVYCSEWGQMNIEWRSGLYTAGILNGFERLGEFLPMACPAVWLQSVGPRNGYAPRWGSSHILYDHRAWFPAPTYVVQKFWRDHFAPNLLKMDGPDRPVNAVATKSADGKTLFFKAVNVDTKPAEVTLNVGAGFRVKSASMQVIAVELGARNSLEKPDAIRPVAGEVKAEGQSVRFTLPENSVAIVTLE